MNEVRIEERLRQVLKADREGRLLLLPVKMGETLWLVVGRREESGALVKKMHHIQKSRMSWANLPQVLEGYGKCYFKTRAEAEAVLQDWKAENE